MPRLIADLITISWAASSHAEFSSGVRRSARQTALAMTNSGDILISANSRRALSRSSSSMVAVTSQVTHSLTCGAVNADCTIAWAVALRTPLIGMRVRPSDAGGPGSTDQQIAAPAPSSLLRCEAARTSSRVITPPGPLPVSCRRSTPRSLASLRTGGLASTRRPRGRRHRLGRPAPAPGRQRSAVGFRWPGLQRLPLVGPPGHRRIGGERPGRQVVRLRPSGSGSPPPAFAAAAWPRWSWARSRPAWPPARRVPPVRAVRHRSAWVSGTPAPCRPAGGASAAGRPAPSSMAMIGEPDLDRVALGDQQLADRARVRGGQLDQRLAGLHLHHDVVDGHGVTDRHPPGDDVGLDQPLPRIGQPELPDRHRSLLVQ